jgi:hypothetical protein
LQFALRRPICFSADGGPELTALERFLGDSPLRVLIKLLVLSLLVGLVMSAFGWTVWDLYWGLRTFVQRIWDMGFAALGRFGDYVVIGAAVVIPAFLIIRILSWRRHG